MGQFELMPATAKTSSWHASPYHTLTLYEEASVADAESFLELSRCQKKNKLYGVTIGKSGRRFGKFNVIINDKIR